MVDHRELQPITELANKQLLFMALRSNLWLDLWSDLWLDLWIIAVIEWLRTVGLPLGDPWDRSHTVKMSNQLLLTLTAPGRFSSNSILVSLLVFIFTSSSELMMASILWWVKLKKVQWVENGNWWGGMIVGATKTAKLKTMNSKYDAKYGWS